MPDALLAWLSALSGRLRPADLLDISVMAVALYWLTLALRRRRSRLMIGLGAAAGGLYLLARHLEMYFTTLMFQAGFLLFLVALIVAFQEEIRRAFHRLATWRPFAPRQHQVSGVIDALVDSVSVMAERSIGALIVVAGKEPLEGHLAGGYPLDAVVTDALLRSVFNPTSPGHDGALIVRGDRAERFAVHLPLSRSVEPSEHLGTRHAAAIGISERTDALVIVVSEERAEIGVAEHGLLERDVRPKELEARLARFVEHASPEGTRAARQPMLMRRVPMKLGALLLAFTVWAVFGRNVERVQQTLIVPIAYRNMPDHLAHRAPPPSTVRVTLDGSEAAFERLDRPGLEVSVHLASAQPGTQRMILGENDLVLPPGLRLYEIDPRHIDLTLEETVVMDLPVAVVTRGAPPPDVTAVRVEAEPSTLRVRVPVSRKNKPPRIETAPIDLTQVHGPRRTSSKVLLPRGVRLDDGQTAEVSIIIAANAEPRASASETRR